MTVPQPSAAKLLPVNDTAFKLLQAKGHGDSLKLAECCLLGRSVRPDEGLQIPGDMVRFSAVHCKIQAQRDLETGATQWFCVDSSTNGTFVNEEKLVKGQARVLRSGDAVRLSFPIPGTKHPDDSPVLEFRFVIDLEEAGADNSDALASPGTVGNKRKASSEPPEDLPAKRPAHGPLADPAGIKSPADASRASSLSNQAAQRSPPITPGPLPAAAPAAGAVTPGSAAPGQPAAEAPPTAPTTKPQDGGKTSGAGEDPIKQAQALYHANQDLRSQLKEQRRLQQKTVADHEAHVRQLQSQHREEVNRLQERLNAADAQLRQQAVQLAASNSAETELTEAKARLASTNEELQTLRNESWSLKSELCKSKAAEQMLAAQVTELTQALTQEQGVRSAAQADLQAARAALSAESVLLASARRNLEETAAEQAALRQELSARVSECETLRGQLEEAGRKTTVFERKMDEAEELSDRLTVQTMMAHAASAKASAIDQRLQEAIRFLTNLQMMTGPFATVDMPQLCAGAMPPAATGTLPDAAGDPAPAATRTTLPTITVSSSDARLLAAAGPPGTQLGSPRGPALGGFAPPGMQGNLWDTHTGTLSPGMHMMQPTLLAAPTQAHGGTQQFAQLPPPMFQAPMHSPQVVEAGAVAAGTQQGTAFGTQGAGVYQLPAPRRAGLLHLAAPETPTRANAAAQQQALQASTATADATGSAVQPAPAGAVDPAPTTAMEIDAGSDHTEQPPAPVGGGEPGTVAGGQNDGVPPISLQHQDLAAAASHSQTPPPASAGAAVTGMDIISSEYQHTPVEQHGAGAVQDAATFAGGLAMGAAPESQAAPAGPASAHVALGLEQPQVHVSLTSVHAAPSPAPACLGSTHKAGRLSLAAALGVQTTPSRPSAGTSLSPNHSQGLTAAVVAQTVAAAVAGVQEGLAMEEQQQYHEGEMQHDAVHDGEPDAAVDIAMHQSIPELTKSQAGGVGGGVQESNGQAYGSARDGEGVGGVPWFASAQPLNLGSGGGGGGGGAAAYSGSAHLHDITNTRAPASGVPGSSAGDFAMPASAQAASGAVVKSPAAHESQHAVCSDEEHSNGGAVLASGSHNEEAVGGPGSSAGDGTMGAPAQGVVRKEGSQQTVSNRQGLLASSSRQVLGVCLATQALFGMPSSGPR